jgi:hypothetical protein
MATQLLSRESSSSHSSQSGSVVNSVKNNKLGVYQVDQQVKYLHLEAELELLLRQLNGVNSK